MTKFFLTTFPERLGQFEAILKSRDEGKSFFFGDKVNKCFLKVVQQENLLVPDCWTRLHATILLVDRILK